VADIELLDEIVEWLAALSDPEYERAVVLIDRLGELGSRARMPFSRSLGQGLFELRFSLGSNSQRLTYRFAKDDRIVLLTTFHKQRMNERTEIDRARRVAAADASERP
jgi:putative component of toxin-antitoxin plasmid stabilization module